VNAEILAFGDELTSGQRVDTNSAWLSQRLDELGLPVGAHTTLGDDIAMLSAGLELALRRSRVVVCTGGLGPTEDDLTREGLASALGVALELRPEALEHIENLFRRRGRAMPARNRVQAMCPQGARLIPNLEGTAPGLCVEWPAGPSVLYALPGVPAEMRQMWNWVEQDLRSLDLVQSGIVRRTIKTFGYGESQIAELLPGILDRGRNPLVGITAHEATISLRIAARGTSEEDAHQLADATANEIKDRLGEIVFSESEEDELPDVVARLISKLGWTIATAEWQTAGELASSLARSSHSGVFRGGTVGLPIDFSRSNPMGPDDPRGLTEMAEWLRRQFGADIGLAFGEFHSPPWTGGMTPLDGTVLPGIVVFPHGTVNFEHRWGGHSSVVRVRATKEALMHVFKGCSQRL
jgi:nicotinamide-nucleotide amidase